LYENGEKELILFDRIAGGDCIDSNNKYSSFYKLWKPEQ